MESLLQDALKLLSSCELFKEEAGRQRVLSGYQARNRKLQAET
jgi:hypothetical protein